MRRALALANAIDRVTETIGQSLKWLVLAASLVSAGNALSRYGLNISSNAWLEAQWYMFAAMFLLGAGYALKHDEHVRVDVIFTNLSRERQAMVDIFGLIFFMFPVALLIAYMSIPMVTNSIRINEMSSDPGGLLRWPIKILIPLGFLLLAFQGISELIKKIAIARGIIAPVKQYERPVQ